VRYLRGYILLASPRDYAALIDEGAIVRIIHESSAQGRTGVGTFSAPLTSSETKLRDALSIAVLNSADVYGYIARVLSGLAGLIVERSSATSRTIIRWRWKPRALGI
jgi:hypothetical protein